MATVTILGNCATETTDRHTTSFMVTIQDFRILIDCGPTTVGQLLRAGIEPDEIDLLIITHSHADHSASYPYFLFSIYTKRLLGTPVEKPLPIIALPEVHAGLEKMFRFQYPPGNYPKVPLKKMYASPSGISTFQFDEVLVSTIPVDHTVPNIGLRLDFSDSSVGFSGDTSYCPQFVELATGVDVLFHEAFCAQDMAPLAAITKHSTAADAGRAAASAGAKQLVMTHLLEPAWHDTESLLREGQQEFMGPILIPEDLSSIRSKQIEN